MRHTRKNKLLPLLSWISQSTRENTVQGESGEARRGGQRVTRVQGTVPSFVAGAVLGTTFPILVLTTRFRVVEMRKMRLGVVKKCVLEVIKKWKNKFYSFGKQ